MIVQSVGMSSLLKGKLASLPRHQKTSSPTPAPTESIATIGFPIDWRSLSRVCTTNSLRPSSASFLMVATTVPITRASCILVYGPATIPEQLYRRYQSHLLWRRLQARLSSLAPIAHWNLRLPEHAHESRRLPCRPQQRNRLCPCRRR